MSSTPVPNTIAEINDIPIKTVNGTTIYVRDVAHVRDGFAPQTNVVRQDGVRGTLFSIMKNGDASTIDIVKNIRDMLPRVAQTLPQDLNVACCSTSRCSCEPPFKACCAKR